MGDADEGCSVDDVNQCLERPFKAHEYDKVRAFLFSARPAILQL
jgi:hypothetical protein